jgi:hypothetical protein
MIYSISAEQLKKYISEKFKFFAAGLNGQYAQWPEAQQHNTLNTHTVSVIFIDGCHG